MVGVDELEAPCFVGVKVGPIPGASGEGPLGFLVGGREGEAGAAEGAPFGTKGDAEAANDGNGEGVLWGGICLQGEPDCIDVFDGVPGEGGTLEAPLWRAVDPDPDGVRAMTPGVYFGLEPRAGWLAC